MASVVEFRTGIRSIEIEAGRGVTVKHLTPKSKGHAGLTVDLIMR